MSSSTRAAGRSRSHQLGGWAKRVGIVTLCYGLFWVLAVYPPFVRLGWGFATNSGSTPLDALLPADPTFRLSAFRQGDLIGGVGETSLPDGSQVQMWDEYWGDGQDPRNDFSTTVATVEDGRFHAEFSIAGWPSGTVVIEALVQRTDDQSPAIASRYGPTWSRMYGPQVKTDEHLGGLALQDFQGAQLSP